MFVNGPLNLNGYFASTTFKQSGKNTKLTTYFSSIQQLAIDNVTLKNQILCYYKQLTGGVP